ncbi:orotate phosphoribosyltransferase [Ekhidna lutea]|uniref:Orotate phosphoribosyltransferase n=2 Tax=Ekhidna lutea TaxID=447679 RepID=A0A239L1H2_EKHLU|nr:orotate phosphoribosyltransferase [Ekhidna lutea]
MEFYFCTRMSIKIYNPKLAAEIAADLLKIGAIKLSPDKPFTWASGWKSPIYCDNRLSLSYPDVRSKIKTALALAISNTFDGIDVIAGVATAGIPQGALVAEELGLPFIYVRSKSKGHGLQNMIEGKIENGQRVLLVEDLVSTGGSSLAAADALKEAGAEVVGMIAIFTYGFKISEDNFKEKGVDLIVLSDYHHLLDHAQDERMFENEVLKTLKEWRENPGNWK